MNYCNKIHYTIYKSADATFERMADELLAQLPADECVLRLIVFGNPEDNIQFLQHREILRDRVNGKFVEKSPALSYVSQPSLEGGLVMEVHSYSCDEEDKVRFDLFEGFPYAVIEAGYGSLLFAGGFQADLSESIFDQSQSVFHILGRLLEKENFPVDSITRQWNYIERITAWDNKCQHYQMFNNARSEFYSPARWEKGYPAATGIGTTLGGVLIDVDAVKFKSESCFVSPIDNKLQVAAHEYSDQVLMEAGNKKTTPKFERAKSMTFGARRLVYISGTAAIRGEDSLKKAGIEHQVNIVMDNIAQLIDKAKIQMLRVYLKNPGDYGTVNRHLSFPGHSVSVSYLYADICRDELLVEIEGIAIE